MHAVIESGLTNTEELIQINHYRCHQQVLFVSDVLDASGKAINKRYLERRTDHINWSVLIFPIENPPRRNLKLWQQVLYSLAPHGRVQQRVRHFLTKGHKIWEWQYNESAQRVYHIKGNVMDIYTPSVLPQFENRWNCWSRLRIEVPAEELGDIFFTVRKVALAVYSVVSSCTGPPVPAPLLDFWTVIESWGNTWLWDNLTIRGVISWLADAIVDNSLTAMMDGSYMKDTYPHLNSAAFVFECTKSKGRLWGSFVEHSPDAGSYRGELSGLMAIHLILKAINEVNTYLRGPVHILSDCLGAPQKIEDLPPTGYLPSAVIRASSRTSWQTVAASCSTRYSPTSKLT
jgi:hypothetical protein